WKGVLHELYWFISGQSNIKYLVDNNVHIWDDYPYKIFLKKKSSISNFQFPISNKEEFIERIKTDEKFAKEWGNLPRIYGEMWRRWPARHRYARLPYGLSRQAIAGQAQALAGEPTRSGRTIDQLKWVIAELTEDPFARNAIVTSWNPEYLYTMAANEDASRFPICHNMYQVSVKNGKLSLQLYQRSADLFLGVPFNIASYALLTIILAQVLGYKPGEFVHTFGDVHIYENHLEQVKEQLKREPKPFPTVTIDSSVKDIDDFKPEHVTLKNYDPHPVLKGELTVAGGLYEKDS
ncbi:thymidylate synthase, partial [Candidatus Shapirobacteria bacterium]|nr:thymidylate synthase [Candidatus Shapirobacteria bacterium]